MPGLKNIGSLSLKKEVYRTQKTIVYEAEKLLASTKFIVVEYLDASDYEKVCGQIGLLSNSSADGLIVPKKDLNNEKYIFFKSFSGQPVCFEDWKDTAVQIKACMGICEAFQFLKDNGLGLTRYDESRLKADHSTGEVKLRIYDYIDKQENLTAETVIPGKCVLPVGLCKDMNDSLSHTLACILFNVLVGCDPYYGRILMQSPFVTDELTSSVYGGGRVFIFDKNDCSNSAVPGMQTKEELRWSTLPGAVQEAFAKSLSQTDTFVSVEEWKHLLEIMRRGLYACPDCKRVIYLNLGQRCTCPWCGKEMDATRVLTSSSEKTIPLMAGQNIVIRGEIWGQVLVNAEGRLIIRNTSKKQWQAKTPSGNEKTVEPGQTMPVREGLKVCIGGTDLLIK